MYALQADEGIGSRWRLLLGAGLTLTLLCATGWLLDGRRYQPPPPLARPLLIQVVQRPLTALPVDNQVEPARPEAPPEAKAPVTRKAKPSRPPVVTPAVALEPTAPAAEVPLRLGLTLSSTTTRPNATHVVAGSPLGERNQGDAPGALAASAGGKDSPGANGRRGGRGTRTSTKERTEAKLRQSVAPNYPAAARKAGIEGVVVLSITIDSRGHVQSTRVLLGLGYGLDEAAAAAARATLWQPAALDGHAIETTRRFSVRFSLEG